nr:hypothetical protein [Tanacetum cinerariifolium]
DDIPLTIKDDNLRDKLLNVNLLIATIEALNDNPTPSSYCKTKSSSTSLDSLLEETSTFHNSLPEFENFYFDLGEISSGSTTTHSDISLPDYEAFSFDDDHIKEISSGSTTTHSDISLSEYDSFIFDHTHEEFVDELAHIISPPEYDCFYFRDLPDPGELMSVVNSEIRENLFTTSVNLPIEDDHSPLLAYVVWIFVAYLTYPVIPPYLHPFGNEDTIFDPGITINHFYSSKSGSSHRHGAFKKFNTHRNVEDKILVLKPPKNCARCAKCGHPVNGPYCQGCALLREKHEEDLVSYFQNFQNISQSSDDSTNIVNAPREPVVVKQDHGVNPPHIDKCCCECAKDHFKIVTKSNDDISFSDDDSLYNENIEYVEASPYDSEVVSLEVAEIVIPEEEEIKDDNLRKKLLNVHLLIANIEALKDNPTQSFELLTKSSPTSPKSFLEETNSFHNSLPEFENFYFNLEEINSGSTTTHSDVYLPDYEVFYFDDDHIKEISSGSTTTHSDISLSEYDSFIFDFANEEFTDELAHIIAPPEYDRFYFWNFPIRVKDKQEKDKIRSKPGKNGKRGEAERSQKQLQ